MFWTLLIVLLVLWLTGLISGLGGNLIHLLLVVALLAISVELLAGRSRI